MSTRYAVLLRGVNVGGVTVRSADLRDTLAEAGFGDVRIVLASGNALVTVAEDGGVDDGRPLDPAGSHVRDRAEAALLARFGREVRVVVRSQSALVAIAEACPYAADSETHHAYVVLLGDAAGAAPPPTTGWPLSSSPADPSGSRPATVSCTGRAREGRASPPRCPRPWRSSRARP